MKFALAVLLLVCQGQKGDVLQRNDAFRNKDLKEIKRKTPEALDNIAFEALTTVPKHSRMSKAPKADNEYATRLDSFKIMNNKNFTLVQHGGDETSMPSRKKSLNLYKDRKKSILRKREEKDLVKTQKVPGPPEFLDMRNDLLWPKIFGNLKFEKTTSKPVKQMTVPAKDLFEPVNILIYFEFGGKNSGRDYICSRDHGKFVRQQEKAGCKNAVDFVYAVCSYYRKCESQKSKNAKNCVDLVCSILKELDKKEECYKKLFPCKL